MTRRNPLHSLSFRLFGMFTLLLVVFAVAQQLIYNTIQGDHLTRHYSKTMLRNAYAVSQNLYDLFMPDSAPDDSRLPVSTENLAPYMAMVEQMTNCDVYLVDSRHQVTTYADGVVQEVSGHTFPVYIEQTIALGFMGKSPVSVDTQGGTRMLCACAPIMDPNSRVLGVVLLTADAEELGYMDASSLPVLLTSLLLATLFAMGIGWIMSGVFSRPLRQMDRFAQRLSAGEYGIRLKRLRRNDEVASLNRSMNILSDKLEEGREKEADLQHRQQEFFSNISHELKTPVTIIRGSLEALHDGVVSPEKRDAYYERTLHEIEGLDRLVRDMLELSRLRSLNFQLNMEEFSLTDLIGETAMSAAGLCERTGIEFRCAPPEKDRRLTGDLSRMRQMLMTVLDNAVKYTPAGGQVSLYVQEGDRAAIVIADTGPGIPENVRQNLFDRWYSTGQRSGEGTGLGLTIAHEIAARHGIEIQLDTAPDRGTTFRFLLPEK